MLAAEAAGNVSQHDRAGVLAPVDGVPETHDHLAGIDPPVDHLVDPVRGADLVEQVEVLVEEVVVELHPVTLAINPERVQMRVRPAHRGLQDHVQLRQADPAGDEEPAPHGGRHLVELDPQLEHLLSGGHRGSVRSGTAPRE